MSDLAMDLCDFDDTRLTRDTDIHTDTVESIEDGQTYEDSDEDKIEDIDEDQDEDEDQDIYEVEDLSGRGEIRTGGSALSQLSGELRFSSFCRNLVQSLHHTASTNLNYINQHLHSLMPSEKPTIADIYNFNALSPEYFTRVPSDLQLHTLLMNFNEIAKSGFSAQPSSSVSASGTTLNRLVMYYGIDKLRSFNMNIDQSRCNLVLAVFTWAAQVARRMEPKYEDSHDLWYSYANAWFESIYQHSNFSLREAFIHKWQDSRYDITKFPKAPMKMLDNTLRQLQDNAPPCAQDPVEFLKQCTGMSHQRFKEEAPAMALHFLFANEEQAKRAREAADIERKELEDMEILPSVESSSAQDEMTADDSHFDHYFLVNVDWKSDWMQALLHIDKSYEKPAFQRIPDRNNWIEPKDAVQLFKLKLDKLAELKKLDSLSATMEALCII